jgi:SAM-dependent methyltransferase
VTAGAIDRPVDAAWAEAILRCPECRDVLTGAQGRHCAACGFIGERRDLRVHRGVVRILQARVGGGATIEERLAAVEIGRPPLTYAGPKASRDSVELLSELSARLPAGGDVLDLGCGPRDQAPCLQSLGFRYVGVDYVGDAADFLADAHALPFADASFDCVFSYAVLEHLRHPFVAIDEVARVLRPGGWYIGTVSLGEPFHDSYFNCTPWGLLSLVDSQRYLAARRLWASHGTLLALATMGRYSRPLRAGLHLLDAVHRRLGMLSPRRRRWSPRERELDALLSAASVCFAIEKCAATEGSA